MIEERHGDELNLPALDLLSALESELVLNTDCDGFSCIYRLNRTTIVTGHTAREMEHANNFTS